MVTVAMRIAEFIGRIVEPSGDANPELINENIIAMDEQFMRKTYMRLLSRQSMKHSSIVMLFFNN